MKTTLKTLAIGIMALALGGCVPPMSAFVDSLNVAFAENPTKEECDGVAALDSFGNQLTSGVKKGQTVADVVDINEAKVTFTLVGKGVMLIDDKLRADWDAKCRG